MPERTNKRHNIMHLVLSLEIGGLERLVSDSAIAIDKDKFNVEVCCFNRLCGFHDTLLNHRINVTLIKRNQQRHDYLYALKLRRLLVEKKVDILHMHSGTFFHGTQAGLLARTPAMVYTDHGRPLVESKRDVITDRFSGYFVDKIVAVSTQLENYLKETIGLPGHKITTIINGINTDIFAFRRKQAKLMSEFGITEDHKVIGTVGRLAQVKDHATLIDAFSIVQKEIPNCILMIVGDGPMRDDLEDKISKLNLTDTVKLIGNRDDVPYVLNLFDVFVLPSLSEGTSIALLEAMASGIASIVTDVGGNPSIIDDKINGLVVRPQNINQISAALNDLLSNDNKRENYARAASRKINAEYSIVSMLQQYTDLYLNILKDKCYQ